MDFFESKPLYRLREIAAILRGENGCAWDRKQSHDSLKPYLIEEAYELYDAIESGDAEHMKEELGDVLYQVYAHARIADEKGLFTIDDVAEGISEKLVRRHPHVFGEEQALTPDEVTDRWEKLKRDEKSHRESILDGVPRMLPALLKAYRIQQKVSRVGFDWEKPADVVAKLDEEVTEFKEALESGDPAQVLDEAGDLLFVMVNILRFFSINAEEALQKANDKFIGRFREVEILADKEGRQLESMTLAEMDILWKEAKKIRSKN
jgi:tetrapyrrole methylase family protein/MazG family protein